MPTREEHLRKARHNEQFYATVDAAAYSDWAITVIFYAALHYVDAFLARIGGGINPGAHDVREGWVQREAQLRPIAFQYMRLKNRSRNARYAAVHFTPEEVRRAHDDDLTHIKNHLLPLI
jgi:hypothetical protein